MGSTVNLCAMDLRKAFDKVNHHGLFVKLMNRKIPVELLKVLEYWYFHGTTCVRWGCQLSFTFATECGIRQGGVLSPYLFACYVDDIVAILANSGHGCVLGSVSLNVFLYADDILLLSPSVTGLQVLVRMCELELNKLEMSLNVNKTVCLRIGARFKSRCAQLETINGDKLNWVLTCRYLGVYLHSARKFQCDFSKSRQSYHVSVNSIFESLGGISHEDVLLKLLVSKCLPVLTFGLDAVPVSNSDMHSYEFILNRTLMRVFKTGSLDVVKECCTMFCVKRFSDIVKELKCKFLLRYLDSDNHICNLFCDIARLELKKLNEFK